MHLPSILAIRVAMAGWMASPVKAGYVFRKVEMACSNSASLASAEAEITSPKIKKGKNYGFFACINSHPHLSQDELTSAQWYRYPAVPKYSSSAQNRK